MKPDYYRAQPISVAVVSLAGLLFLVLGGVQAVARMELRPPDAVAAAEFTDIVSVRELGDGSVLVSDRIQPKLVQVEWGVLQATVIGRSGSGPREYRGTLRLYPLAGDSTLCVDSYNGRWILMEGARIVGSLGERRMVNRLLAGNMFGSDEHGHVLGVRGYVSGGGSVARSYADSLVVLLVEWASGRVDTVARMEGVGFRGSRRLPPRGGLPPAYVVNNPLAAADGAVLFPDGWIALVHQDPYRVDWRTSDGRWVHGAPLPSTAVRVTDREKCAAWTRWFGTGRPCEPSLLPGWPEMIPPFQERSLAAPDGRLVIPRTPTLASPEPRYDVVDRLGHLVGTITMAARTRLVGFGARSVYTAATDDEWGVQTLRRHPWP